MQPVRNPDILYNKAISALTELLQAVQADAEPDMNEILLLKTTIKILYDEKMEQHQNFQRKVVENNMFTMGGNY